MDLRFEEWLISQQERNDLIGDLARLPSLQNAELKSSRRKSDEHKNWADIVISIAEPEHIAIFNEAWQEFLLAKQADTDPQE
jgi:hypothetical protein